MKKILPLLLLTTTVCAETHLALPIGNAAGDVVSRLGAAERKKIKQEAEAAAEKEDYARALGL